MDVIALDRANECFGHSVALWTFDGRGPWFKPDVASEAAGIASDVATALVRQPLDVDWQAIDPAEAILDGCHHQVAHIVASDASRRGQEPRGLLITAVERKGSSHPLAVVAADLETVGAPAPIAFIHRNAAIVTSLHTAGVAIEQQAMGLHHAVDRL